MVCAFTTSSSVCPSVFALRCVGALEGIDRLHPSFAMTVAPRIDDDSMASNGRGGDAFLYSSF